MKQTIDIEDLLIWAYRDQCVDRVERAIRGVAAGPKLGSGGSVWELGTRVDTSGAHAADLGAKAPDDAPPPLGEDGFRKTLPNYPRERETRPKTPSRTRRKASGRTQSARGDVYFIPLGLGTDLRRWRGRYTLN